MAAFDFGLLRLAMTVFTGLKAEALLPLLKLDRNEVISHTIGEPDK